MLSDNIHGMISSVRIQYVLDRYLKKVRLPKYRDATVSKEQDIKEFKEILNKLAPKHREFKYFAQVFQAIRIEVNQELAVIEEFLAQAPSVLKPEGRLVIMSFHSLEDRLVKNFIKAGNIQGKEDKDLFGVVHRPLESVTRKPTTASEDELKLNPRSRSAKLRIASKL